MTEPGPPPPSDLPEKQSQSQSQPQDQTQQNPQSPPDEFTYIQYDPSKEAEHLPAMRQLISKDLSEPYSIYVYRYFLYQWGDLCFMCFDSQTSTLAGCIISKLEPHTSPSGASPHPVTLRGYVAMLAVHASFRNRGLATHLVRMAIDAMASRGADEIVLETEISNVAAMKLYQRLGFLRTKRLHRYYLNANSAFRLVLPLGVRSGGVGGGVPLDVNLDSGTGQEQGQLGGGDEDEDDGLPKRENGENPGRHIC